MESNQNKANLIKVSRSEYIDDMFEKEYIWFPLHNTFRAPLDNLSPKGKIDLHQIQNSGLDKKQKNDQIIAFFQNRSKEEEKKDEGIKDSLEMNITHEQLDRVEITGPFSMLFDKAHSLKFAVRNEHYPKDHYTLISCFYFLEDPAGQPNDRYKEQFFVQGKKMLVIKDVDEFQKRIRESITNRGFDPEMKRVTYYNPEIDNFPPDSLTPFHKSNKYAHQNEFRIGMRPGNFGDTNLPAIEPIRVPVPGLKQLSYVKDIYPILI